MINGVINFSVDELVIDNFAGGGGATKGIEDALGRPVDIAINHDAVAIMIHKANHPDTLHLQESVWDVDPVKVCGGRPVGLAWFSPDCFPSGTIILTDNGYRPIEEIQVGDIVLTHKMRWRKVTKTYRTKRPLIKIRGHGHPGLVVSPEHPLYTRHRTDVWDNDVRQYNMLDKDWYWATPTRFDTLAVPNMVIPNNKCTAIPVDERLMWLVGRYLGDGWTRLTTDRAELVIICGKHEEKELIKLLDKWPRTGKRVKLGELSWNRRELRTAIQFTTNSRVLVGWLRKHFGHGASNKRVPGWALGMEQKLRENLLSGYLSADGYDQGEFDETNTVSKPLAFGIKALANSLGKTVTVYRDDRSNTLIEGRTVNVKPSYHLRWRHELDEKHKQTFITNDLEWAPVREKIPVSDSADVYNIAVKDDESYIAEGIVVHNCTHFSKAKGGKPVDKKIRGLAWVVVKWAAKVKPRLIMLENVEEFVFWGPVVDDGNGNHYPCPERKGRTFKAFVKALENKGYVVEWRQLRACDYGVPTIRKRLFMVARCDGKPIVWPEPTHGDPRASNGGVKAAGLLKPWRTAAECIDWTIPCPSVFERKKPLAEATQRRIALGVWRYVINTASPFIVTYYGSKGPDFRGQPLGEPLRTQTTANRHGLVVPFMIVNNTHHTGSKPDEPLSTLTSGNHEYLVNAFLAKHYTGIVGSSLGKPIGTITAIDHHALVTSHLVKLRDGQPRPTPAITTGGNHAGEVRAFLLKYYGTGQAHGLRDPLHTITAKDRFALVTVNGVEYQIIDIGMRMLTPRELFRAQGFPENYVIDHGPSGERISKKEQVAKCGNSVCPGLATALVRANVMSASMDSLTSIPNFRVIIKEVQE